MSRWRIVAGTGLILAVALVGSAALAANGLKIKSATVALGPDETGSASAQCERGTKAVSGGFEGDAEPESSDPTPFLRVISSGRAGGRRWASAGLNRGSATGDLTSFAYCRDERLKRASTTVPVGEGDGVTATAKCPRGTKAFSGGFEAAADSGSIPVKSSKKAGKRRWSAASASVQFGAPGDLTAHVFCRDGKALKTKSVSRTLEQSEQAQLVVKCKRGQRVISGGFEAFEDEELGFASPTVATSRKRGRRTWIVDVVAANETSATAYAYCEKVR